MARLPRALQAHSLAQLLGKLHRFKDFDQAHVWSAYRACRRTARRGMTEFSVEQLTTDLYERITGGRPYDAVVLGAKLAQAFTLIQLRQAGATGRHQRALAKEGFHLVRMQLRERLGMRSAENVPSVRFGSPDAEPAHLAWSDGAVRGGRAAAAYLVHGAVGTPALQAAQASHTTNALEAELEAALLCLDAMLAAGIRRARLHVDALGVLRAFQGKLALKFCVLEAQLLRMAGKFQHLEVRLVPRAFNDDADRLAAALLAGEA
ncbi:hypothetical protein WDL1P1_00843 (plasmid) [Variovorax sp. WDL1]|nr:hypothetical protein CHC06_05500 [Variovorax sp. B2]PNG50791.1 hypothetical protein CHC07_05405 [Variovorax sp. B4]VTV18011.1 hypothetical protein WDL1P1_00843 [Variovorax sp. WDL1]